MIDQRRGDLRMLADDDRPGLLVDHHLRLDVWFDAKRLDAADEPHGIQAMLRGDDDIDPHTVFRASGARKVAVDRFRDSRCCFKVFVSKQ